MNSNLPGNSADGLFEKGFTDMLTSKISCFSFRIVSISFLIVAGLICNGQTVSAQCIGSPLAVGLDGPSKLVQTPLGNLIVAESGTPAPNSGRVSIVDLNGNRRSLLEGLPSGFNSIGDVNGPSGLFLRGRTLYVLNGEGNATLRVAGPPPFEIANPEPNSPIMSSILAVHFSAEAEKITSGFALSLADHEALKNGEILTFSNGGGDRITVQLVADFPDYVPEGAPPKVRHSNPFGMVGMADQLYVTDGGRNLLFKVDIPTHTFSILTTFPPIANPLPFGPPVSEAVPDSVREYNGQLLVTLLGGFPFAAGTSSVVSVDPLTGTTTPFITGLTSGIDVLRVKAKNSTVFLTLEVSTDLLADAPGRLQRFDTPAGPGIVIATCPLIGPSNMVYDAKTGALYITEIFTGRIIRLIGPGIPAPPKTQLVTTQSNPAIGRKPLLKPGLKGAKGKE